MKVLIVGAHPDDYEIGMAGTIKKHTSNRDEVYSIIMSKGGKIGHGEERAKESLVSAELLGIKKVFSLDFEDTNIPSGFEAIEKIEKIIKELRINRIYTHSIRDVHQDHRNTSRATLAAGRNVKQILFYESPSSDLDFRPTFFVEITDFLDDKLKVLAAYNSLKKVNKRYFEIEAIKSSASFRGYQSNVKFAESFEIFRFLE